MLDQIIIDNRQYNLEENIDEEDLIVTIRKQTKQYK